MKLPINVEEVEKLRAELAHVLEGHIQRRIDEAFAKACEECAKLADAHRTCGRSDCPYAIAHEIRSLAKAQERKHDDTNFPPNQTWNGHIFSWQQIGCRWRIVTDAPDAITYQFLAACTG